MDYPVLVNPGKPLKGTMKKKTSATAPRAAKGRKESGAKRKTAPKRARSVKARAAASRLSGPPDDAKPAVRRLRPELAQAQARIEELQASADHDFLLAIANRRGFERELHCSI